MSGGSGKTAISSVTVVLLLATFCLSTFDITEHDYWWHLATGKYIIAHRLVPHRDVFSYTATRPWGGAPQGGGAADKGAGRERGRGAKGGAPPPGGGVEE